MEILYIYLFKGMRYLTTYGAIILAAGQSKRMGQPKLLLPIQQKPMIQYVVDAASHPRIDKILIVTGAHATLLKQKVRKNKKVSFIHNPVYVQGMGTSLRCGMEAMSGEVDAVFVFLGDQPFVSPEVIESMSKHYERKHPNPKKIIRPMYEGKVGHPVLFSTDLVSFFSSLNGDIGGREIIKSQSHLVYTVPFHHEIWGRDIDTPKDFTDVCDR